LEAQRTQDALVQRLVAKGDDVEDRRADLQDALRARDDVVAEALDAGMGENQVAMILGLSRSAVKKVKRRRRHG
jgi:DNA-binding NarL/FixJ family response regulator